MDMFSKLTTLFQQALETREPSIHLLDSFVEHWKGITNYYIETTDETKPANQTDIPWRLKQMLDILVYEEKQQETEETGPCMEYLLQHKILETLCTLGKAQYPPGMNQQVLLFFSKLLAQIQQPMLHIINVYRPVQKLIRLCALPWSRTEKEEAQFLFILCSRMKQDPYVLKYLLEIKTEKPISNSEDDSGRASLEAREVEKVPPGPPSTEPGPSSSPQQSSHLPPPSCSVSDNNGLVHALVHLTRSQNNRVSLKALEGLQLLAGLPEEEMSACLSERTALCQTLAERLCELYSLVPSSLDPADIYACPHMPWRARFSQKCSNETDLFPGSEHLQMFMAWLDYCNHLVKEAHGMLSVKLAKEIHHQWLTAAVEPQLLQLSEAGVLACTAVLSRAVRHIDAPALLEELVLFLLGSRRQHESRSDSEGHTLRRHLIRHCDHISDEISITTLHLFEELLQKPHEHILHNLALRNLEERSYLAEDRHLADAEPLEESEELEEDPFFTDIDPESDLSCSEGVLSLAPPRRRPHPSGETQVVDIVNSFLCLVPQEAKTSQHVQEAGYDTYVHDAHKLFKECKAFSLEWGWPALPKPLDLLPRGSEFYEGHFLKVLFDRVGRILEQPYELNLQVTSVLSRLAVFPHPHLHEYLLDPYINLAPGSRSLFSVLVRVIGDLMQRTQHIPNFTEKLVHVRKQLMSLEPETLMDHVALLKGVIVLEEFCKELAAIAFVKLPMEEHAAP